jgi:hypothetical protein
MPLLINQAAMLYNASITSEMQTLKKKHLARRDGLANHTVILHNSGSNQKITSFCCVWHHQMDLCGFGGPHASAPRTIRASHHPQLHDRLAALLRQLLSAIVVLLGRVFNSTDLLLCDTPAPEGKRL